MHMGKIHSEIDYSLNNLLNFVVIPHKENALEFKDRSFTKLNAHRIKDYTVDSSFHFSLIPHK